MEVKPKQEKMQKSGKIVRKCENRLLPDINSHFIDYTNYCEEKGYTIDFVRRGENLTCNLLKDGKIIKIGVKKFSTCIDAQEYVFTKLYFLLKK